MPDLRPTAAGRAAARISTPPPSLKSRVSGPGQGSAQLQSPPGTGREGAENDRSGVTDAESLLAVEDPSRKVSGSVEHASKPSSLETAADASKGPSQDASSKAVAEPQIFGIPMRWVSLVLLTAQTTGQVFVIKWAKRGASSSEPYLASTVVLLTEVLKTVVSFGLLSMEENGVRNAAKLVFGQFEQNPIDSLKVCIPSLLYTFQNNLMFYSLYALSAAVQQVTYQLKILTTALFSVLVLGKVLEPSKWFALFLLLAGVVMVMMPRHSESVKTTFVTPAAADASSFFLDSLIGMGIPRETLLGLIAVLAACMTSGFASVYLEKLLKQTKASIWLRNVQLGAFGSAMAVIVAFSQDGVQIADRGLLQGYSVRVVCVVLTNALGGLLCAAVLKYADNILRCFSTALSIITTCLFSALLQEYEPDALFALGTLTAITSTFIYSLGLPRWFTSGLSRAEGFRQVEVKAG